MLLRSGLSRGGLRGDGGTAAVLQAKARNENVGPCAASTPRRMRGHLAKARELTKRHVEVPIRAGTARRAGQYGSDCLLSDKPLSANFTEPGSQHRGFNKLAPASQGAETSRAFVCHGGRHDTSRALGPNLGKTLSAGHADAVALLPAIQGRNWLWTETNPAVGPEFPATSFSHRVGANWVRRQYFCLYHVYVRGEAYVAAGQGKRLPPPSFRRSSTTAALSGTAGRERWRIWE